MASLVERARVLARKAIAGAAHDVTDDSAGRSALVLAPHPDDETLGCGGVILRKARAGTAVTLVMVTDGRHSHSHPAMPPDALAAQRRRELALAAERLGLPPGAVRWLDVEDGTVSAHEDRLGAVIAELLEELRPDELYATSADEPHPDHAAVGRAARRAAMSSGVRVLEYPIWLWGSWPLRSGDRLGSLMDATLRAVRRRAVLVRTDDLREAKLHALDAHRSQLQRPDAIPSTDEWHVLPEGVLDAARGRSELFFTVRTDR